MKYIFPLIIAALMVQTLAAQIDGARTYWAMPKNTNLLSVLKIDAKVNASINNLHFVRPDINIDNSLWMLTYTRSQPIFGRTFYSTFILPAGDIKADVDINILGEGSRSSKVFQHGLGDLIWVNSINLIGAKGLMIKDFVRHENPTLIYLQAAVTFPTGQYNANSDINMGSNQYKLKVGTPIVQRLGKWTDGSKATLEIFPSYTFISKNNDLKGQEIQQDGAFILETHLTKDITKQAYISLDYSYIDGGALDFIEKESGMIVNTQAGQRAHLLGGTVKYKIHDQLHLMMSHFQTFSSGNDNVSLEGSVTKLTLSFSFHDFQEKFNNFINSN